MADTNQRYTREDREEDLEEESKHCPKKKWYSALALAVAIGAGSLLYGIGSELNDYYNRKNKLRSYVAENIQRAKEEAESGSGIAMANTFSLIARHCNELNEPLPDFKGLQKRCMKSSLAIAKEYAGRGYLKIFEEYLYESSLYGPRDEESQIEIRKSANEGYRLLVKRLLQESKYAAEEGDKESMQAYLADARESAKRLDSKLNEEKISQLEKECSSNSEKFALKMKNMSERDKKAAEFLKKCTPIILYTQIVKKCKPLQK